MLRMEGDGERGRKVQSGKREAFKKKVVDNISICERVSQPWKILSKPGSQSDSSFGDSVCPVGNTKTPIAIIIVDYLFENVMNSLC